MRYLIPFLLVFALPVEAEIPGPVQARILSVYDGDTFTAEVHIWIKQYVIASVRVLGADTPEIRGECDQEKALAIHARERAKILLGETVTLSSIAPDKYGGRVDAVVILSDGRNLANVLIEDGLARPYDGGERLSWCE